MRIALHIKYGTVFASGVVVICLTMLYCHPIDSNWDVCHLDKICVAWSEPGVYSIQLGLHIVTNLMLWTLPFPLLKYLSLNRQKKYSVGSIFALGFLCMMCTVTRALVELGNPTSAAFFDSLELAIAIVIICCPAFKAFMTRHVRNLRSKFRTTTLGGSSTGQSASTGRSTVKTKLEATVKVGNLVVRRDVIRGDVHGDQDIEVNEELRNQNGDIKQVLQKSSSGSVAEDMGRILPNHNALK